MKKILAIVLSLMAVTALFNGCSKAADKKIAIVQFAEHGSLDNCRNGFIEGLSEAGFVEGENLEIEIQNAQADMGITNQIAQSAAAGDFDMICAIATPMAQAAYNAAQQTDIPVIFTAVNDPVAANLADETRMPKGNITGTSDKLPIEAQLKLIRAMLPEAKKIGILYSTSETNSESAIAEYKQLAGNYDFEIVETGINQQADIPLALDNLVTEVDCLSNLTDNTVVSSLPVLLDKAEAADIPVFGSEIEQVKNGCIAAAGIEYIELGKQTGKMAARVLNGENAAEIAYESIENSSIYINKAVMDKFAVECPEDILNAAQIIE